MSNHHFSSGNRNNRIHARQPRSPFTPIADPTPCPDDMPLIYSPYGLPSEDDSANTDFNYNGPFKSKTQSPAPQNSAPGLINFEMRSFNPTVVPWFDADPIPYVNNLDSYAFPDSDNPFANEP